MCMQPVSNAHATAKVYITRIFHDTPLAEQPKLVADMGCGDGTLLQTIDLCILA